MKKICIILLLSMLYMRCTKKTITKKYFNTLSFKIIDNNIFDSSLKKESIYRGTVSIKGENYFYSVNRNLKIHFRNTDRLTDTFNIDLKPFKSKIGYGNIVITERYICFLDIEKYFLENFAYDKIIGIKKFQSINLNSIFNRKDVFIYPNIANPFYIDNNSIYIPYIVRQRFSNIPKRQVLKKLRVVNDSVVFEKNFFDYPDELLKKKRYTKTSICLKISDSIVGLFFNQSDYAQLLNTNTNKIIKKEAFTEFSNFENFDRDKEEDISYLRFYEQNNEHNYFYSNANKVIVLKRQRNQIHETSYNYDYYVLNDKLEIENFGTIKDPIIPLVMFKKNGFSLFSLDYKNIYTYYYY